MVKRAKKTKVLKESHVSDAYEVTAGFNYPDGDGEKRVEAGAFVFEKDYKPEVWKALKHLNAVKQVVKPETDADSIAAEVIG